MRKGEETVCLGPWRVAPLHLLLLPLWYTEICPQISEESVPSPKAAPTSTFHKALTKHAIEISVHDGSLKAPHLVTFQIRVSKCFL